MDGWTSGTGKWWGGQVWYLTKPHHKQQNPSFLKTHPCCCCWPRQCELRCFNVCVCVVSEDAITIESDKNTSVIMNANCHDKQIGSSKIWMNIVTWNVNVGSTCVCWTQSHQLHLILSSACHHVLPATSTLPDHSPVQIKQEFYLRAVFFFWDKHVFSSFWFCLLGCRRLSVGPSLIIFSPSGTNPALNLPWPPLSCLQLFSTKTKHHYLTMSQKFFHFSCYNHSFLITFWLVLIFTDLQSAERLRLVSEDNVSFRKARLYVAAVQDSCLCVCTCTCRLADESDCSRMGSGFMVL